MTPQSLPPIPVLRIDDACVAEARRALVADHAELADAAGAAVVRFLVWSRALPAALDALGTDAELFGQVRLLAPRIEGELTPSREALCAVATLDAAARHVEVRLAAGPIADELVESDAPVLCRVWFPFVPGPVAHDGDEVRLQRFGHGPAQRR